MGSIKLFNLMFSIRVIRAIRGLLEIESARLLEMVCDPQQQRFLEVIGHELQAYR